MVEISHHYATFPARGAVAVGSGSKRRRPKASATPTVIARTAKQDEAILPRRTVNGERENGERDKRDTPMCRCDEHKCPCAYLRGRVAILD